MKWWTSASLVLAVLHAISEGTTDCQVQVPEPWPTPYLFIPKYSTLVEMNCTAIDESKPPIWSVDLANDSVPTQLQFGSRGEDLNARGIFQIVIPGMPSTRRLLINRTEMNNQTVIYCDRRDGLAKTTLFVFCPSPVRVDILDVDVNFLKLSWSNEFLATDVQQMFSLNISNGSSTQVVSLSESYYYFTAPEGAPPCEVYTFSVTATYVGATYTGAGCSAPSPVVSTMLPSLPNISQLQSSLHYSLEKGSTGLAFRVSFKPASYCVTYPTTNYTLVVNGSINDGIVVSDSASITESFTVLGNLSENASYSFRVLVANTVGTVSTNDRHFYTTDIQVATATLLEGVNASTIQCKFITGSNATGCMVVLTSRSRQEAHYSLMRDPTTNSAAVTVTLKQPSSCYSRAVAFDIESDGSVGSLAIPGQLIDHSRTPCTPPSSVKPGTSGSGLKIGSIAAIVVALIISSTVIALIIIMIIIKKCQKTSIGSVSSNTRCHSVVQSSTDGTFTRTEPTQLELTQESYQLTTPTAAEGTACSNASMNIQSGKTLAIGKGENFYSEIGSTCWPTAGIGTTEETDDVKSESTSSELRSQGECIKGASLGGQSEVGREKTSVPPEEALYDQPVAALKRTPGDGAEYSRTCHHNRSSPVLNALSIISEDAQYSKLDQNKDHIYFTLEPERLPCGVTPAIDSPGTPRISDTQAPTHLSSPNLNKSPPPIYQEITELTTLRGETAPSLTHEATSTSNTTLFSSSLPQIQKGVSFPLADGGATQTPNQWVINVKSGTMV